MQRELLVCSSSWQSHFTCAGYTGGGLLSKREAGLEAAAVLTGFALRLNLCLLACTQIRYKEEFEKNKGKGFCVVTDTPELQRIKKIQDQISDVSSFGSLRVMLPEGGFCCSALGAEPH